MLEWFVVIAKQNQDALVVRGLREQGYEAYSPKTYQRERVDNQMKSVGRRRLSPYVFVAFDVARGEATPVKNTRGVERIVPEGRDPEPLRHGAAIIAWLRQIEEEEFSETDKSPKKGRTDLKIGERVKIVSGDNKTIIGLEGELTHLKRGKAAVFVGTIMLRDIPDVDLVSLEPAPAPAKKKRRR